MTPSSPSTSLSLLERAGSRDPEAWRRLLAIYEPLLRSWLRSAALQACDRDDLVQQILAVLVRKLPTFQHSGRPGAFRAWLRQIALHELSAHYRRRATLPELYERESLDRQVSPLDELTRLWDEEYDRHVLAGLLQMVRGEFSAATWRAFWRVAVEGAASRDVAADLGLMVNAVTIAKSRVLRRLRQEARGLVE